VVLKIFTPERKLKRLDNFFVTFFSTKFHEDQLGGSHVVICAR